MKKLFKQFRYGQKGFTLIELLVVVAILGVLAAVAVPNVGKFLETGREEAADTELHNVQLAVMAAMTDAGTGTIPGVEPHAFGDVDQDQSTAGVDVIVDAVAPITVGGFIVGGADSVQGDYDIMNDGTVDQVAYPGLP